ncbi:hypothetical protein YTXLTZUM_CDS0172 [Enterococcus phage VRE9_3]
MNVCTSQSVLFFCSWVLFYVCELFHMYFFACY